MAAGDERDDVRVNGMTMTGMSLEALDAVVWDGLETCDPSLPVEDVPRALRRLARAGARATEGDCDPLYSLVARDGRETPSAMAVALPFVVALAADPGMGARVTLVELLVALDAPGRVGEDWDRARSLLADPDPAVRRAAIPLARGVDRLLGRWRVETDLTVRLPVLLALGEAAADPAADRDAVEAVRAVLADVLGGDDPVMWVGAVHASRDSELAIRHLDRLVEVFSDLAVRPRFAEMWFVPTVDGPCEREDVLWWIERGFESDPEVRLSFVTRLIEAARWAGDALLCREAMDLAWRMLLERRSVAAVLLPLAGGLLDDPDGAVRLRAANMLAALGPAAAPYADRLAELLDDDGADAYLDGTVREIARWALARIGDPRALPGLVEQLRAQEEEQGRGYGNADPRRPDVTDVLIPLRAHTDVLLPALREAIRQGGARGGATRAFIAVLEAWGEAALPALPDLLPLLADTWTSMHVVGVLRTLGPAARAAGPALRTCEVLDYPGNHWAVTWTAMCISGDRAAELRLVGDAVLAAEERGFGPSVGGLAQFGRDAAPYAERARSAMENGTGWPRLEAAITLWSITGRVEPTMRVLEEFVLPVAAGGDGFRFFHEALRTLIRIGAISPAIRAALQAVRESDHRLSGLSGYQGILQDEELRALIEQALACAVAAPGRDPGSTG
ncbi:HEAT repeat domain-containing protein [Streptomyces sp. NPDC091371]|uniref:HEAT repeat domain-containing protein n=1 Tax=Streptomyces sp. NPDC091371 TaxID=3155303 RepID=UPI003422A69A